MNVWNCHLRNGSVTMDQEACEGRNLNSVLKVGRLNHAGTNTFSLCFIVMQISFDSRRICRSIADWVETQSSR
jgi:hypothetical protein